MKHIEGDKWLITPDDTIEESKDRCYELVRAAIAEATRNGIKANSIVINKNMVRVPERFGQWPEMICGLHCFFTADELPDGYAFSIHHAPGISATVVHGRWVGTQYDGYADGSPVYDVWECSECRAEYESEGDPPPYNFCPNCGAKMDVGGD